MTYIFNAKVTKIKCSMGWDFNGKCLMSKVRTLLVVLQSEFK